MAEVEFTLQLVRAVSEYKATNESELSFKKKKLIKIIDPKSFQQTPRPGFLFGEIMVDHESDGNGIDAAKGTLRKISHALKKNKEGNEQEKVRGWFPENKVRSITWDELRKPEREVTL